MGYLIHKLINRCDMVLSPVLLTGATSKVCLMEPKHRKFTGCNADLDGLANMMPSLLFIFAEQVLDPDSGITGSGHVHNVANFYLAEQRAGSMVHRQTG